MTELFFKTGVRDVFIATDDMANIAEFSESEDAFGFEVQSTIVVKNVINSRRYSADATTELLTEFKLLRQSLLAFGTASSAISKHVYFRAVLCFTSLTLKSLQNGKYREVITWETNSFPVCSILEERLATFQAKIPRTSAISVVPGTNCIKLRRFFRPVKHLRQNVQLFSQ